MKTNPHLERQFPDAFKSRTSKLIGALAWGWLLACASWMAPSKLEAAQEVSSRQLVIVDPGIPGGIQWVEKLNADIRVLRADQDALEQITAILAEVKNLSRLTVLSEGQPSEVRFSTGTLNLETLASRAGVLRSWRKSFANGADLLIYSCSVGQGRDGLSLVRELARTTGLDVAASSNPTGPASLGGDTRLEVVEGEVGEADVNLLQGLSRLPGVLGYTDKPNVTNPGAQSTPEDVNYSFASQVVVQDPGSDRMEVVVKVLSGNAVLSDGEISATELASQGSKDGLNSFLSSLALVPAANWNGAGQVEVTVTSDFNNRTAGNTTSFTFNLTVNAVNDAPVASGSSSLAAVDEDSANPAGGTVSALFSARFSDSVDNVAGGSSANSLAGIAIVGSTVEAAKGQWQYHDGSAWVNVGARGPASTLLLPAGDSLRFLPASNWFGTPSSLSVRLVDSSSGAVTRGAGPDLSGGASYGGGTVYSSATVSLSTSVTPVNDAPVTAGFDINVTKNLAATFSLTSTDDDGGTNATTDAVVTHYRIVTLPANGTLRTSTGTVISAPNTDITIAQATDMTFTPTTNYVGASSFTFSALDAAGALSPASTAAIDVQPFNEPPVVTTSGPAVVSEDSSLSSIGSASVADPDAASGILRAVVTATHGTVTLNQVTGLMDAASGGAAISAGAFASRTFYGTMANINAALSNLRYTPVANYFGSAEVSVTVNDLGNTGSPAKEDAEIISITVSNTPDIPVTGASTLAAVNEDTLSPSGASVVSLLTGFSDLDGDALAGVAISANTADAATEGRWQYSVNNGVSWSNVGAVSTASALLVNSAAKLRFLPVLHYYGTPGGLRLHAVDSSGSRAFTSNPNVRQALNVSVVGDDYDATGALLGTTVTSVNDLFTIVNDFPLLVDEGGTAVLNSSRLSITDVEADASQIVYTVLAAGTNLDEGSFQLDTTGSGTWTPLAADATFTQAQINAGRLRYVHNGNEPTAAQTLAYSVTDQVAGAGGSTSGRVLSIQVTPVNDAPKLYVPGQTPPGDVVALNGNVAFNSTLSFSTSNLRVVDSDNLDVQLILRLESLPVNGTLKFNSAPVAVGSVFSYASLGLFTYTHDGTATVTDVFSVSLRDGAGGIVGAAGGTPAAPVQVPLTIVPYNHPPTISNAETRILERSQGAPFALGIADEETATADLVVKILTLPSSSEAVLKFNGTTVTQAMLDAPGGFSFPGSQLSLLLVNHVSANRVDPPAFSFGIRVTDDGNIPASTDATVLVLVRPVDDEPTLAVDDIVLPSAGATAALTDAELDGQDVDTPDTKLLYRVTVRPAHGTLLLGGVPIGVGGTFTQDDVSLGRVTYVHRGTATTTDSFKVTLRDQGYNIRYNRPGGVYPDTSSTTLLEHTVNVTIPAGGSGPGSGGSSGNPGDGGLFPAVAFNDAVETNKNITLVIDQAELLANDGGITPFNITSVQMKAGFTADGSVSFDNGSKEVTFVPTLNFSGITRFEYTMEDALGRSATADVFVTVFYVNYPPVISTNVALTLDEGAQAAITAAQLEAEDIDDSATSLVYTLLSMPGNGDLYFDSTPADGILNAVELAAGDIFSQADINAGRIKFAHDGHETFVSTFTFRVTDGANPSVPLEPAVATFTLDATPVNDSPVITTEDFIVSENTSFVLTPVQLGASDVDGVSSDKAGAGFATVNTLTYVIAEAGHLPLHGRLQRFTGGIWTNLGVGDDFTAAQVAAGGVRYLHDGTETTADSVTVTLDDNTGAPNASVSAVLNIGVVPVNDDPVIVRNDSLELDEGASAVITFAGHLQGEDPDNDDVQLQFRLTSMPQFGTLWLNGAEVLGVGSKFTQKNLKDGLISYHHNGSESTSDSFNFTLSDGGGGNEPADTFDIIIHAVNDAPVVTLPAASINAVEAQETDVRGIVVGDDDSINPVTLAVDTSFGPLLLTLSVNGGILNVREDRASVTGTGSGLVTVEGTLGQINDTLASLVYEAGAVATASGSDSLTVQINDQGHSGSGGPLGDVEVLSIIMLGVNNPPVVSKPAAQSVDEDTDLVLSTLNGNAVSFSDPDIGGGNARATLSVLHGKLTLGSVAGLVSVSGDGTGSVTITGPQAAVNVALNGLTYRGSLDFNGPDTLTITVSDLGNTGTFGGALSDTETLSLTVNPVNDAPVVAGLDFDVDEDDSVTFSLESTDVDAGSDPADDAVVTHYFIQIRADSAPVTAGFAGELRTSDNVLLLASNSVTPPGFAALPAGQHIITAAQAADMTYAPGLNFNSSVPLVGADWRSRFEFRAIDVLGADYASTSKSDAAETTFTVAAINDAPVLAGGGDSVSYTEGDGLGLMGSAVVLNAAANLTVTDVEITEQAEDDFAGATLVVRRSTGAVTTDRFLIVEQDGISLSGSSIVIGGVTRATVTTDGSAGLLVIGFNASATRAHVQTLLRNIAFASVANDLYGSITARMTFNDGNDTEQGTGGSLDSNDISFTINISNVNDAPSFAANGLFTVPEDTAVPAGASISSIMGPLFSDPDPAALEAGKFSGIAITADASNQATQGRWQFSVNGTDWHDVTPLGTPADHASATHALLLSKDSLLRFIPVANFNDRYQQATTLAGALTVVAVDNSGSRAWTSNVLKQFTDTVTGWDDISDLGSAGAALLNVSVTQVNDQPAIANLDDDSTFTEAVGVNVAGPAVLLDDLLSGSASMSDIDLSLREETTYNGARLVVKARTVDSFDFFLPQIAGGISLSGSFTNPGPGIVLFNNGSLIRYNSVTIGTLTDNSSVSGELVITFNASATKAAVDALLQNLTYSNNDPTLSLSIKPIDITFHDGNGSAGNIQGAGGELSTTVTVNMNLVPRNDSPVLTQGATIATTEDVTTTAVSFDSLLSAYFQDPDELAIPAENDFDGVAVSAFNNASLGEWQVSLNGTDWVALSTINSSVAGGISTTKALLLNAATQVRFVPSANANTAGPVTKPSLAVHPVEASVPAGSFNSGIGEAAGPVTFSSDLGAPLTYDTTANPLESRVGGASVAVDAVISARNDAPLFASGSAWTGTLIESPVNGVGTSPAQQLLSSVSIGDVDPATTATLSSTIFGAGTVTVAIGGGVTGDRFFVTGSPAGIGSQSGGTNGANLVISLTTTTTFSQLNAILEAIRFEHTTDYPPTGLRSYTVTVNDSNNLTTGAANAGGPSALSVQLGGDITIVELNDPPLVTSTALNPTFMEDTAAPAASNSGGTLFSGSSVNVTGSGQKITEIRLTVGNLGNGTDEVLRIDGQLVSLTDGNTATASFVDASTGFGGAISVSVSGSTATVSYVKAGGLTASEVQTLINGLRYHNGSDAFVGTTRVVTLTYMQDDGGTDNGGEDTNTSLGVAASTVTLQPRNDAPVLASTLTSPTAVEQGGALTGTSIVPLFSASSLGDVDFTTASFGGGSLTISFASYVTGDVLDIDTATAPAVNAVRVSGSNVQISLDGSSWTTVGTVDGTSNGLAKALVINLNAAADEANVGAVLNAVRYHSTADNPTRNGSATTRSYSVIANDGNNNALAGGLTSLNSNLVTGGVITITPDNDSILADLNGGSAGNDRSVTWTEAANSTHLAVSVAPSTSVTDPDNANVASLSIAATGLFDGDSEVLRISGTDFLLGTSRASVDVGSFLVSYNAATGVFTIAPDGGSTATLAAFQALLQGITYNNSTDNPTAGGRVFTVTLTDAGLADDGVDGQDGTPSAFTVQVTPNNDQPVIAGLTGVVFMENAINAAAAVIDADITVTDIDSPTYDGGTLTVSGLVSGQDVVSLPASAAAVLGAVRLNGASVEYHDGAGWTVIGTASGGSGGNFVVTFNATADRTSAERVLESLTFANTSDNPTLVRTLTYTLNDGGANPALPSTIGVTIRLENDEPVLAASVLGATYVEGDPAAAFISGTISLTDPDAPSSFYNSGSSVGGLTVSLAAYHPGDLFSVAHVGSGAGQIGVSGASISYGGSAFATFSGGGGSDLVITFTSNAATPSAVQALLAALRFSNTGDDPTVKGAEPTRAFEVVFNDGANTKDASSSTTALTASLSGTLNLTDENDVPVLDLDGDNSSGAVLADYRTVFITGGTEVAIADVDASLTDVDQPNLQSLTLVITSAPDGASESLSISGVLPGGITAGAYSPATRTLNLTGPATADDFAAALKLVHYGNSSLAPTLGDRLIQVVANDGVSDSNTAVSTVRVIDVTVTTTTPVNEASVHAFFTVEGTAGEAVTLTLGSTVDPLDQDATITGFTMEYKIGAGSWIPYTWNGVTGDRPTLPGSSGSAGTVLVRVNITPESDTDFEDEETFTLTAAVSGGRSATVDSAIHDDGTGVVHNNDGTVNGAAIQDDDRLMTVTDVVVNEGSPYAVFTVTGALGQKAALSIVNETTAGLASIQYLLAGVWTDATGGLVTLPDTTLLVRVALSPEQEQAVDDGETFKLVATNTGGTASTGGAGTIHDDATGDWFLAANLTSTPDTGLVLDDDRPVSVTNLSVNEGSPYAVFTATAVTGQKVSLSVTNTTTTGLSTIQYLVGSTWTNYTTGLVTFADTTMLLRVALSPEQDTPYDNGETFVMVVSNTGGAPSSGGVGTVHDDDTGDYFLPENTTDTPDPGQILDDDRPVVLQWGVAGSNPANGLLDATIIPNTTSTPVNYPGTNDGRFDVRISTSGLSSNGIVMMGGEVNWYLHGYNSSSRSTVAVRFYQPGTNTPKHLTSINFSIEDAEFYEELSSFSYYDGTGAKVSLPWTSPVFTYSHTPYLTNGNTCVENGAPLAGKTQSGKWIRVNLTGRPVSGIEFSLRKRSADAGSIMLSHLVGNPGAFGFAGSFSPLTLNTDASGSAVLPDYRSQTTRNAGVTGVVTQTPAPGSLVNVGLNQVKLLLTTSDNRTAPLGFDVVVMDRTAPNIAAPAGGFPLLQSAQALPDYTRLAVITDNVAVARVTQQPLPGSLASTGINRITITATDTSNNVKVQSFDILAQEASTEVGTPTVSSFTNSGSDASLYGAPDGSIFKTFGQPAVHDSGSVAFMASYVTGKVLTQGVFAGSPTSLVAASGRLAPGLGAAKFTSFYDPCVNQGLETTPSVAFLAKVSTGLIGIWTNVGGELQLAAVKGASAPGADGAYFKDFTSVSLSEDEIVFTATLSGSVTAANNQGVWGWNSSDGAYLLIRKGQQVTCALGNTRTISRIDMLTSVAGSPGQGRSHPGQGIYAARVACTDGMLLNLMTSAEGVLIPVAQNGLELFQGMKPLSIGVPAENSLGQLAFLQTFALKARTVTSQNNSGIVLHGANGWELAVAKGAPFEGSPSGTWTLLNDPVLNNEGALAWSGSVKTTATLPAIGYRDVEGTSRLVACKTGAAPGTSGGTFNTFTSLALPDGMGPVFTATLQTKAGVVTGANDSGLWALDSTGELKLILREGQVIGGKKVQSFALLSNVTGSLGVTRSFNSHRRLVSKLTFSDGSQSIFVCDVP